MKQKKATPTDTQKLGRYMVLVLGMHRSGTSTLAGVLHHLGCALPEHLMVASKANPKGYFESAAAYRFNDQMLREAGTSWRDWRPVSPAWLASPVGQARLPQARDLLIEEFGTAPLTVFKDPRNCRMVAFWTEAAALAGFRVLPVLIHRNPLEVAKSLQQRDGIAPAESYLIWLRHILDAEAATRNQPRFVTSYDQILTNWSAQIIRLQQDLDLVLPHFDDRASTRIEEFLSPKLRHFTDHPQKVTENRTLSRWVRDAYEIFERWCVKGESKADYKTLDLINADLDAATPVFSQLIDAQKEQSKSLNALVAQQRSDHEVKQAALAEVQTKVEKQQSEMDGLRTSLEEREKEATDRKAERESLEQALETRQAETDRLKSEMDGLRASLGEREKQATDHKAEREGLEQDLETRQAEAERLKSELDGLRASLDKREKQAADDKAQRENLQRDIETGQAEAERLKSELDRAQRGFSEQEDLAARLNADLDRTRTALAQSESTLAQRRLEAEQAWQRADDAEARLASKSGELETLSAQGQVRIRELADLAKLFHQSEKQMQAQTDEADRLRRELEARQARTETARAGLQAELTANRTETARLQNETAAQQAHIQFVESELAAIRASRFWRATKPLRALIDTLRGNA